jgi:hypothetical protein
MEGAWQLGGGALLSAAALAGCALAGGGCAQPGAAAKPYKRGWSRGHQRHGRPSSSSSEGAGTPAGGASEDAPLRNGHAHGDGTAGGGEQQAGSSNNVASSGSAADGAQPTSGDGGGKLEEWEQLKAKAAAHIKGERFEEAASLYSRAAELLNNSCSSSSSPSSSPLSPQRGEALAALHRNCAFALEQRRQQLIEGVDDEEEGRARPAEALRLLPLIVLDCGRALKAGPTPLVRYKALKSRASALESMAEEGALLQAMADLLTAQACAKAQLEREPRKKQQELWKRHHTAAEAMHKKLFVTVVTARLQGWRNEKQEVTARSASWCCSGGGEARRREEGEGGRGFGVGGSSNGWRRPF